MFYKDKEQNQDTKRALGKQEVSLGESGSFGRWKSKFPLGKVQEAKKGEIREFQGLKKDANLFYILPYNRMETYVLW